MERGCRGGRRRGRPQLELTLLLTMFRTYVPQRAIWPPANQRWLGLVSDGRQL
ncbi:hypothetical protein M8C21_015027 [Ambrosia artemisiifolia]|uniref:Uncharacterized protein n=1 Tax=Ambrosia artemisiifolia TaxID=4212 RepID=A0AAD5C2S4_AMBAR|nr:hypothetical protein M8C21_015027 [Ambrosia artemisiifolia]